MFFRLHCSAAFLSAVATLLICLLLRCFAQRSVSVGRRRRRAPPCRQAFDGLMPRSRSWRCFHPVSAVAYRLDARVLLVLGCTNAAAAVGGVKPIVEARRSSISGGSMRGWAVFRKCQGRWGALRSGPTSPLWRPPLTIRGVLS
ncbi:hypothetical protein TraAM80_10423 [Trypanosoma rangeli]|uniref:Secreted protein n=1 Tax=Trypanosoma rangeli TaxID=5698 RepID=A0A422MPA7_TRYRA|nr:uncharacterized protein TraAM80_10423 [Trypanosoma rangeli]RNE95066.1 hypothetical protein TraAM80_10423 [Trypanosoma rangeli]|eukprot:RNE95066.1 hypothetical protein TraAM80_10423 [Trypanosoma rangeli]